MERPSFTIIIIIIENNIGIQLLASASLAQKSAALFRTHLQRGADRPGRSEAERCLLAS